MQKTKELGVDAPPRAAKLTKKKGADVNIRFDRRRRRRIAVELALLLVVGALTVWTLRRPLFQGNYGVVDAGHVYRFAQPQPSDWPRLLKEVKPASVINLRGGSMKDPWYAAEAALAARGVDVYELTMSARARPRRFELLSLLDLFDRCRYPLLIHCKAGADRTGLASGLYRMYRLGEPPEIARGALTIAHGHVPITGTEHMHEPFIEYQAWLKAQGVEHTSERLRAWVANDYHDPNQQTKFRPLQPLPRVEEVARSAAQ